MTTPAATAAPAELSGALTIQPAIRWADPALQGSAYLPTYLLDNLNPGRDDDGMDACLTFALDGYTAVGVEARYPMLSDAGEVESALQAMVAAHPGHWFLGSLYVTDTATGVVTAFYVDSARGVRSRVDTVQAGAVESAS